MTSTTGLGGLPWTEEDSTRLASCLGAAFDGSAQHVSVEGVRAFLAVTGGERHVDACVEGTVAPPAYATIASLSSHGSLLNHLLQRGSLVASVHYQHALWVDDPIRVGDTVTSRAEVVEVRSGPFGTSLSMRVDVMGADGALVQHGYHRVMLRQIRTGAKAGEVRVDAPFDRRAPKRPLGSVVVPVPDDLSQRYAVVSGDYLPLHTDLDFARASGFDGLVVHGVCTLAICAQVVVDLLVAGDHGALRATAVSFARPVICGTPIEVSVVERAAGMVSVGATQAGRSVLRDSWAVTEGTGYSPRL